MIHTQLVADILFHTCKKFYSILTSSRARFTMPGDSEGLWYSFNIGPVHFVAIETEAYYFMNYGIKQLIKQYEWLDNDLREANKPEARYMVN